LLVVRALLALGPAGSQTEGRRNIAQAIEAVAKQLGNTKAICRKCYVHPAILDAYLGGKLGEFMDRGPDEKAIVGLLEARTRRDRAASRRNLTRLLERSLASARRLQRLQQPLARGAS
jgi:DNA topoisomerase IB